MSPQLALFILVALLVVGWFALGTHFNVRKGEAALRWLQEGLPQIGEKTTLRWLGSSAVELKIQQAQPPFRAAELTLVLEPRDVPPIWLISRLRGRRDLFIFRGTLRVQPDLELEAFDPGSWSTAGLERKCGERRWTRLSAAPPLVVFAPGRADQVARILQAGEIPGCPLVRLSVRRAEPEFEVQWQLSHLRNHPASTVFQTVRRITECL
jgi:hypothetical protein